jgi:hypothetical protein
MSGGKTPFGGLSVRDRLRAECEERGVAYPLAFDKVTGTIVLCEQCPCLVTQEQFDEVAEAVRDLEREPGALLRGVYLVSWDEDGFGCRRITLVH